MEIIETIKISLGAIRRFSYPLLAVALAACLGGGSGSQRDSSEPAELRLGYFANITHASAIVGVEKSLFEENLGPVKLVTSTFNAGPAAVEALFADAIDATYIGPSPAINAFIRSDGKAIRIISGATSGGASLIVQPEIQKPEDLRGRKIATPQVGNTQDVALRHWLAANGFSTDLQGGGDVSIVPQENAQTLETFRAGEIDGAWVPEPWATRLEIEGGGRELIDERTLWPGGQFVTTHLVVRTAFLEKYPQAIESLIEGQVAANEFVNRRPSEARKLLNESIGKLTGKLLPVEVIDRAWAKLTFTNDPIATSLRDSAKHAFDLDLLTAADIDGIYQVAILNKVLVALGEKEVEV